MVDSGNNGNTLVLECADLEFGGITAMDGRWCQLEINVRVGDVLAEGIGCFVVEFLQLGIDACTLQAMQEDTVCFDDFGARV